MQVCSICFTRPTWALLRSFPGSKPTTNPSHGQMSNYPDRLASPELYILVVSHCTIIFLQHVGFMKLYVINYIYIYLVHPIQDDSHE